MAKLGANPLSDTLARGLQLLCSHDSLWKAIGITIDWSTVAAVSGADVTLKDDTKVVVGDKYLRYGQVLCKITASGKYGPYDPAAADGRQTLARGDAVILNATIVLSELGNRDEEHFGALEGGSVWKDRLVQAGTGTASLAAGPQLAGLLAAFPQLRLVG